MEDRQIIGGLDHYFNNSARAILLVMDMGKLEKGMAEESQQMFIAGMKRLEGMTQDEMLQAYMADMRITAEKIDWADKTQLERLKARYDQVKEFYNLKRRGYAEEIEETKRIEKEVKLMLWGENDTT